MIANNRARLRSTQREYAAAVALCALLVRNTAAEVVPLKGVLDSRVRTAAYDGEQVYQLRGMVGYQIDIEFEVGETFIGLGAGDLEGLSFVGQDNHLFLKPKAAKVATNLTVLTNRRHYQIDYAAISPLRSADQQNTVYALRFTYTPSASQGDAKAASRQVDAQLERASMNRILNIDYWYCGQPGLRPMAASDDGVHTRLKFPPQGEFPAIFVRNDDGSEALLNYSMDAGDVIVHRVVKRFVLRRGKLTGCIVNQGFAGSGTRLDSGTVAPDVQRQVQGEMP